MQQVREQDGEHLTYAGGLRVAQAVLDEIKKEWFPKKGEAGAAAEARQVGDAGPLTPAPAAPRRPERRPAGGASPPAPLV